MHGVSPLIWRRLLVRADTTIAGLDAVVQTAFGWDGEHLQQQTQTAAVRSACLPGDAAQSAGHLPHRRRRGHPRPAPSPQSAGRAPAGLVPHHDADHRTDQLARGLRSTPERAADIAQDLQRVKWFLWHGNVFRARQTVDDLTTDVGAGRASWPRRAASSAATSPPTPRPSRTTGNADSPARSSPPRSRNPRSTRSSANAWSRSSRCAGAPAARTSLLQIRTRVLNDTLAEDYRRWYPDFTHTPDRQDQAA